MSSTLALDRITIKGFKSIASIENLELRPINVLIGANGSGKSNFIEVFRLLREIFDGRFQHYVNRAGGAKRLLHFGSAITQNMWFQLLFENRSTEYILELSLAGEDSLWPDTEYVLEIFPNENVSTLLRSKIGEAGISDKGKTDVDFNAPENLPKASGSIIFTTRVGPPRCGQRRNYTTTANCEEMGRTSQPSCTTLDRSEQIPIA